MERNSDCAANTNVTYDTKLSDTHNAININIGIFTAPINGSYAFFFYSELYSSTTMYAYRNNDKVQIFYRPGSSLKGENIYFLLELSAGDKVRINSGSFQLLTYAKFTGFLLPSFDIVKLQPLK